MDTQQVRRNDDGRFAPGTKAGPGRPKRSEDRNTVNGKLIKAQILESWHDVDGPALLRQLAADNPKEYLSLVFKAIGRELANSVDSSYAENRLHTDLQKQVQDDILAERAVETDFMRKLAVMRTDSATVREFFKARAARCLEGAGRETDPVIPHDA